MGMLVGGARRRQENSFRHTTQIGWNWKSFLGGRPKTTAELIFHSPTGVGRRPTTRNTGVIKGRALSSMFLFFLSFSLTKYSRDIKGGRRLLRQCLMRNTLTREHGGFRAESQPSMCGSWLYAQSTRKAPPPAAGICQKASLLIRGRLLLLCGI